MCEHCQNTITVNAKRMKQFDPTFTTSIRNAFVREMNKRFNRLMSLIKEAIVDQDVFGLGQTPVMKTINVNATGLSDRQFSYKTSSEKVDEFMQWLKQQQELHILQLVTLQQFGRAIQEPWTNLFIADSYKRGIQRGRQELSKAGAKVISIEQSGGIMVNMNSPFHADRVGVLYSRVFTDLQGITSQMDTLISRVLSQGIIDGDNPRKLARKILTVIDGRDLDLVDNLGRFIPAKRRAEILARTEVIRAHHLATIQEFENYGVIGVEVIAEFITAGDDKVCEKCKALEGKLFSIEIARNLIPVHPLCRCVVIPKLTEALPQEQKDNMISTEEQLKEII